MLTDADRKLLQELFVRRREELEDLAADVREEEPELARASLDEVDALENLGHRLEIWS